MVPLYLFIVIGIEGAGHHLVETLWRTARVKQEDASLHQLATHDYSPQTFLSGDFPESDPAVLRDRLRGYSNYSLFGADSYPEGEPYVSTRHPDALALAGLEEDGIRVRFVFMDRDVDTAVASAERRFGYQGERSVAMAHALQREIDAVEQAIPAARRVHMSYEKACADPAYMVAALQELLHRVSPALVLPASAADQIVCKRRKPKPAPSAPQQDGGGGGAALGKTVGTVFLLTVCGTLVHRSRQRGRGAAPHGGPEEEGVSLL